jgi:hypothetical protein
VVLYRGATVLVPDGTGSLVTEFLEIGTEVRVPFFLEGLLRRKSLDTFRDRVDRLWRRAAERAAAPPR